MSDTKFWVIVLAIVAATIVSLVAIFSNYVLRSNEQISVATTCEAAVLIYGGAQVNQRLLTCAINRQKQ